MELPFVSSIEIRSSRVLDQEGIDGTVLPEDDIASASQKRGPETFNESKNEENTNGSDLYSFLTPDNSLRAEMDSCSLIERQEVPPQQIPGKFSKIRFIDKNDLYSLRR